MDVILPDHRWAVMLTRQHRPQARHADPGRRGFGRSSRVVRACARLGVSPAKALEQLVTM
jgi:hypothetical protein